MALTPTKSFQVPYKDPISANAGLITNSWQWFFRDLYDRVYSLGIERQFTLVNNQKQTADITGLKFDETGVTQVFVDYLVQRVTTSTGATELIEAGFFILSYRPTTDEWRISLTQTNTPDDSGVDFMVTPKPFTATYDHTTGLWTRSALALINGAPVTLIGTLPSGYSSNTTYFVINAGSSTFKLSASAGGSAVTASTTNGSGITVAPTHAVDGQVQYTSSNITGTASISSFFWRARTIGGKNAQFSSLGKK